jgi:hypothetical protein
MIGCFDGESFDANDYVDFIVFAKIRSFVIQGKALPFYLTTGYSANFRLLRY